MRKLLLIAFALAGLVSFAAANLGGVPGQRDEDADRRVSGAAAARAGSDADRLERHGIYRIVPADYSGALPTVDLTTGPVDPGQRSTDPAVIRQSPLYVDLIGLLPEGFRLEAADTMDGGINVVARQIFRTEDQHKEIQVSRARRYVDPIDIFAPATDGKAQLELDTGWVARWKPSSSPLRRRCLPSSKWRR